MEGWMELRGVWCRSRQSTLRTAAPVSGAAVVNVDCLTVHRAPDVALVLKDHPHRPLRPRYAGCRGALLVEPGRDAAVAEAFGRHLEDALYHPGLPDLDLLLRVVADPDAVVSQGPPVSL